MKSYMFIDGAYLDSCARGFCEKWYGGAYGSIDYKALGEGQHKVFYYDALPVKKVGEPEDAFAFRYEAKLKFFNELRALDCWHVQLGISKRYTGKKAEQKEVDVLLAVDMLTHAYRKNMEHILFLTGDQDFRPLIDAVVRDGVFVRLMYDKAHASSDLIDTADARAELDFFSFHSRFDEAFRKENPAPVRCPSPTRDKPASNAHEIEFGFQNGKQVAELWRTAPAAGAEVITADTRQGAHYIQWQQPFGGRELLKRVFEEYNGAVEWRKA